MESKKYKTPLYNSVVYYSLCGGTSGRDNMLRGLFVTRLLLCAGERRRRWHVNKQLRLRRRWFWWLRRHAWQAAVCTVI